MRLKIAVAPGRYCVCRLDAGAKLPTWATDAPWMSLTRTADELSIVVDEAAVPPDVVREHGFVRLTVEGPLPFHLTGILARLAGALAAADVSVFAVSTYDTDHLLVKAADLDRAVGALRDAGVEVTTCVAAPTT